MMGCSTLVIVAFIHMDTHVHHYLNHADGAQHTSDSGFYPYGYTRPSASYLSPWMYPKNLLRTRPTTDCNGHRLAIYPRTMHERVTIRIAHCHKSLNPIRKSVDRFSNITGLLYMIDHSNFDYLYYLLILRRRIQSVSLMDLLDLAGTYLACWI